MELIRRPISVTFLISFCLLYLFFGPASSMASSAVASLPGTDVGGDQNHQVMAASNINGATNHPSDNAESSSSLRRFLNGYHPRSRITCDWYPKICRARGSPGRTCCRRRCVDLSWDYLNCGRCGRRCRYGEACCRGRCVNVMFDRMNCGWCNRKCRKRSYCRYGMCSYAH